jgi:hypothetical protein
VALVERLITAMRLMHDGEDATPITSGAVDIPIGSIGALGPSGRHDLRRMHTTGALDR